ncbi:hypothetical protein Q6254_28200, partial [Klebsiella pneumoniae]|nr:hypothetical protein [Klebsiella pneumoniae]
LAFIAGVDRILDMARTELNVVGKALAVLVIAKWEHKFDRKKELAYEREVLGKFDKTAQKNTKTGAIAPGFFLSFTHPV